MPGTPAASSPTAPGAKDTKPWVAGAAHGFAFLVVTDQPGSSLRPMKLAALLAGAGGATRRRATERRAAEVRAAESRTTERRAAEGWTTRGRATEGRAT